MHKPPSGGDLCFFFVFLVILDGFAMVLAGVFGFLELVVFSYGLIFEAA